MATAASEKDFLSMTAQVVGLFGEDLREELVGKQRGNMAFEIWTGEKEVNIHSSHLERGDTDMWTLWMATALALLKNKRVLWIGPTQYWATQAAVQHSGMVNLIGKKDKAIEQRAERAHPRGKIIDFCIADSIPSTLRTEYDVIVRHGWTYELKQQLTADQQLITQVLSKEPPIGMRYCCCSLHGGGDD